MLGKDSHYDIWCYGVGSSSDHPWQRPRAAVTSCAHNNDAFSFLSTTWLDDGCAESSLSSLVRGKVWGHRGKSAWIRGRLWWGMRGRLWEMIA